MARRRRKRAPEPPGPAGFLVVDKPAGWTSHDVVDAARGWLGTRRVGHLGTLDPQATGVLPLCVRAATKLAPFLDASEKRYVGTICFGAETDTYDAEGTVLRSRPDAIPDEAAVLEALGHFRGEIEQIPPMYSAVKQGGVPLHRLARKGEVVEREPKTVTIHRLELEKYEAPNATVFVDCSPGTYVRTLAVDLGEHLGCGAYLASLRRLGSGPFDESMAVTADQLEREAADGKIAERLIEPARALGMPVVELNAESVARVRNGGDVSPGTTLRAAPGARVAAHDPEGQMIAVLELRHDRRLWPLRVLET
jgi:tRNA pseudouridine55 synthase